MVSDRIAIKAVEVRKVLRMAVSALDMDCGSASDLWRGRTGGNRRAPVIG
jgi:hypothetical protein